MPTKTVPGLEGDTTTEPSPATDDEGVLPLDTPDETGVLGDDNSSGESTGLSDSFLRGLCRLGSPFIVDKTISSIEKPRAKVRARPTAGEADFVVEEASGEVVSVRGVDGEVLDEVGVVTAGLVLVSFAAFGIVDDIADDMDEDAFVEALMETA
jgi:hypothetical protein